jgi:hypothetical protein
LDEAIELHRNNMIGIIEEAEKHAGTPAHH